MQALQQLAEEPLGGIGVAPALHQDVEQSALADRTPEITRFAADPDEHLIEKPFVAWLWATPFQNIGEQPAKAQAPCTDAFIADHHAAGGQDQFDITLPTRNLSECPAKSLSA